MKKARSIIQALGVLTLGASLPGLQGQAQSPNIEQHFRKQYGLTRVGANGTLVQPGVVLTVQADGIKANPASYLVFWPNNYKKGGGRVKQPMMSAKPGLSKVDRNEIRFFQVGEKVYLTQMEIKDADLIFSIQSCGGCNSSGPDPNDPPYRAEVSFQLGKGYLNSGTLKDIQETIGQVFAIDAGVATHGPDQTPAPPERPTQVAPPVASVAPLKLPSTYAKVQTPSDQLQLNGDSTFSLQEAGQTYGGTFATTGNTLELNIKDTNTRTALTIQGNGLIDSSGQAWVLSEQTARRAPSEAVLQNQDVIKMVKAGLDDALIIAKIGSSKCQFDTSTDALDRKSVV